MNRDKVLKAFYIFLLSQPFIDLITSLIVRLDVFPITLGIIIRGLTFLIGIIYIFFISKSVYKKKSIIYLIILLIYSVFYFIDKREIFSNFNYLLNEITYMFKYYYTLVISLTLFNFFDEYKPNNRKVFKMLQTILFLYCFIIVLANITNTAFATYTLGGAGNTGWFYSGNEVGVVIALLFPYIYLLVNKTNSYKTLLYIIPIILGIEIIGTKTSMLALLLPTIVFIFYYLIRFNNGKKKQFIMSVIALIIIIVSSPNLPVVQNIKDSINRFEMKKNIGIDDDYSDEMLPSVLMSDRDYYNKKIKKIYDNSNAISKIFGIGFVNRREIDDKNISKLIEMDFNDIFYRYGIIGFLIYITPFIYITYYVIKYCFKNKLKLNMKQTILLYNSYIGLIIAYIAGHTLGAPAVSFYLAMNFVLLIYYLKYGQYKIELDENKVTIMALHLGIGGIEKYLSSLCKMLEDNYKIELVSTYKVGDKPAFEFSDKIHIKYLINDYPHKEEFKLALREKKILLIIKYGFSLFRILILKYIKNILYIEEDNSKYIITTRYFHNKLVGINKNRDIIAIATEHNYHNNDKKYINKLLNSLNNIDYLVVVSEELEDFYTKKIKKHNMLTKCIYIPNVIDGIPKYNKKERINNKLISIGRLVSEKGYEDLIEIISIVKKSIPEIKLDIYGDGELKEILQKKISNLELENNINLCGFCSFDKLSNKLGNYDLYLMTSYTESFGLVLIEAMSNSLACIGFDSASGVRKLLKDGNGILISNRDKEKYAKYIINLLNNLDEINNLSKRGYESTKKYDIKIVKQKWIELINNTITN